MGDLTERLQRGDPLADEPELSAIESQVMRRAVVSAVREPRAMAGWPRPVAVAATLAFTLTAGVIVGQRLAPSTRDSGGAADAAAHRNGTQPSSLTESRQLQFATPGGTRIIWVFNPDFKVSGD